MIAREEIEFTLAMAEKGIRAETPANVMAELCRVYLEWLDAQPDAEGRRSAAQIASPDSRLS